MAKLSPHHLIVLIGVLFAPLHMQAAPTNVIHATINTKKGVCIALRLEAASSPEAQERGLMHRTSLEPHDGMVFLFKNSAIRRFWMKNTSIPLDILFVDEKGNIVYIAQGKPLSEEPLGPKVPAASVIEIALGRTQKEQIMVGDAVSYDAHCPSNTDIP